MKRTTYFSKKYKKIKYLELKLNKQKNTIKNNTK